MNASRKKQAEFIEALYIDLLAKMNIFLEKLNEFSKAISKFKIFRNNNFYIFLT
jgi:hypothetical protein